MKNLIAVLGLLLAGGVAAPAGAEILSPTSCSTQTVTSSTVLEVTGNTTVLGTTAGVDWVKVANQDTANDVFCSQDSAVAISGLKIGDRVAHAAASPWNWLSWAIGKRQPWYCLAATASVVVMVCTHKS